MLLNIDELEKYITLIFTLSTDASEKLIRINFLIKFRFPLKAYFDK